MITKLETIRRFRELTRRDLADRSGISERTIEAYEQRRRSLINASYKDVKTLADVLNVEMDRLIDDPDE